MTRSELWVQENAELLWYYRDAESEMGARALPIAEAASERGVAFELAFGVQPSPPPPSRKVQDAARRQAIYRRAVRCLEPLEQAILSCAYSAARHVLPELESRHGAAAAVVQQASRASKAPEAVAVAVDAMREAQDRYVAIRRAQKVGDDMERDQARRKGQARRVALLARLTGQEATTRERALAWLEAVAAEMRRREAGAT